MREQDKILSISVPALPNIFLLISPLENQFGTWEVFQRFTLEVRAL